jgi:gamma-glutamyltranspeptidase/glutathione hydrolase
MKAIIAAALLMSAAGASAADFSPQSWPAGAKASAEQREFQSWAPSAPRLVQGKGGIIAATVSPIAVEAGLDVLRKGGTAADAAASVALTQVATQLGSVVSYAGIMTVVYYDAKTGTVSSLDAGYGTWRKETDPASIPPSDISALTGGAPPELGPGLGRQVLVPGFMAGIDALQRRFGRLKLSQVLQPAIWYAENGVTVSPTLATLFQMRRKQFERTESGREFLHQSGRDVPVTGDVFKQPRLAATLSSVARDGARVMYSGAWANAFVAAVRRDGGKADPADLSAYTPVWSDAAATQVFGHTVYTNGGTSLAPYQFLTALNTAEAMKLDARGPYWRDPETLHQLIQLGAATAAAPALHPSLEKLLKDRGVDTSRAGQLSKAYAQVLAQVLPQIYTTADPSDHHSNALVVVDREGNIAVMTHTINSVVWGDTGIVVGGIPVPDSAGFQQARLAQVKPGERLPNDIADFLVLDGANKPVLAGGSIGTSLQPEVLRIVVSAIAQRQSLADIAAAPALLINPDPASYALPFAQRPVLLAQGGFDAAFLAKLRASGVIAAEVPAATVAAIRGTVALVGLDGDMKTAPEVAGVMVYGGAE